jgi:hypothetical protein
MTKYSLDDIKKKVDELAIKINAPTYYLPGYGVKYGARPYIEVDNLGFMFYVVVSDIGEVQERKMTDKLDELLYWIFSSIIFSMSVQVKNKNEDKDWRRTFFSVQENLLGILDDTWREIKKEEHRQVLINHPFHDLSQPADGI